MANTTESAKDRVVIFDTTLRDGEQCPGATMTLEEKLAVAELLEDGDTRWIHRSAYDLMGFDPDVATSSYGLPRGRALYGTLPEQLEDETSFASRLADVLHVRADNGIATGEQLDVPAVDHPGVPFARAADTLSLVRDVDSPHLRLNLDLYHAQIGEGNLVELCREALPWIGEVQVADVPGRCEPGTGEIRYAGVAQALSDAGYRGVVGLEAFASADPHAALEAFREAFTPA